MANTPRDTLSAIIAGSGLSQAAFADVAGVDARTVRRWLAGDIPIPASRARWLERIARIDVKSWRVTITLDRD